MAFFDESQDNLVIRIVYAGPPFSGKTESLKALSRILKGKTGEEQIFSPSDSFGRTLFFDWFDHSAGLFQGRPIRCQIIAVPGQTTLTSRRKMLVDMADCIVFVADSTPSRWGKNREFLDEVIPWVKEPQPPIGMIFQLNKQDDPAAHSLDAFRSVLTELNYPNPVIRPSSATNGDGLREAFISAVSLGLDRVHALIELNMLEKGKTLDLNGGQQLFDLMVKREEETGPPSSVKMSVPERRGSDSEAHRTEALSSSESPGITPAPSTEAVGTAASVSTEPEPETVVRPEVSSGEYELIVKGLKSHVVAGGVYPPVRGRERMYAAVAGMGQPELRQDGAWYVSAPEWLIRSGKGEQFGSLMEARQHLLTLAQASELVKYVMVGERFIAVTESGDNGYRVWQGVSAGLSAGEWLRNGASQPDVLRSATMLVVIAKRLKEMLSRLEGGSEKLSLGLDNMIVRDEELLYSGFLDESGTRSSGSSAPLAQLPTILEAHLRTWPVERRTEVRDLLNGDMRTALAQSDEQRDALETVADVLGRSPDMVNART
ncbi:MAG: GTPase domain-containing protein [Nitrospira sp.]|nr:GTPase domain-containing protein [Nitrospira sp.]